MGHAAFVGLGVAIAAAILAFDLSLPLGIAGGVPYVALVILACWWPWRPAAFALAAAGTALTIVGYYASPAGGITWVVLTNRGLALFAIWVTATMVFERHRANEALRKAHDGLEQRVAERTGELQSANRALADEIHWRSQAEERLRKSEEQFRAVVDNSPAKIHIKDADGRYTLVNRHAEKLFGVTDEAARGKTTQEIFPEAIAENFAGHDQAVMDSGQAVEQEEEWPGEDGIHTYLTIKFPMFDADGRISGVGAIGTDITERKRAEKAREASEARLAGIVEIAPEAIITVGGDQRIQLFNQGAEEIFGYAADEVLGQPLEMLMPDRFKDLHAGHVEGFVRSPESRRAFGERMEIVALRKDGSEFPAAAALSKLQQGGELLFTIMLHDISDRKHAEEVLLGAKQQAELANRAKSEFLANMSHELRTPLNAIIGFSEMIRDETFGPVGSPKYIEYVKDINESGLHLLELINDILDISRVEAGKHEINEEAIDVPRVVDTCLRMIEERAEGAGLTLGSQIMDDLPPLRADERKFKQVLLNLLSNAVKFTPAGGTVTTRVWCRLEDGYVVQITDTGIGIASADIPTVLSPFGQVDGTLARKYDGTGLGLPLTKSFVEMHGGAFDLQSEIGVGTTVTVRFPAERIVSRAATGT